MKKNIWRYLHFTQVYHKWQSYDVWFLRHEAWQTELFVILGNLLPFYPTKILKKLKKILEISSFYKSVPKIMIICFTVPEIWHVMNVIFIVHFRLFFALLPPPPHPNSPKHENWIKRKKMPGDIIILHMCTKNYDHMIHGSWDMAFGRWMDRWADGKSDIRGECPT